LTGFSFGIPPVKKSAYPAWPASIILIIEDAIRKAFTAVEENLGKDYSLQNANEDAITNALQTALVDLRKMVRPFQDSL